MSSMKEVFSDGKHFKGGTTTFQNNSNSSSDIIPSSSLEREILKKEGRRYIKREEIPFDVEDVDMQGHGPNSDEENSISDDSSFSNI